MKRSKQVVTDPTSVVKLTILTSGGISLASMASAIVLAQLGDKGTATMKILGQTIETSSMSVAVAVVGIVAAVAIAREAYRALRG
jgi:hypothetical protein